MGAAPQMPHPDQGRFSESLREFEPKQSWLNHEPQQIWVARLSKLGIFAPSLAYRSGIASYAQSVKLFPPQCISALRFPAWHAGGQEFESPCYLLLI